MPWALGMQAMPQTVPFDGFPTLRSVSQAFGNVSVTLPAPAGVQDGDLLLLCVMRRTTHTVSTNDPFIDDDGGQTWSNVGSTGQNFNGGYSCRAWWAIASGAVGDVVITGHESFSSQCACPGALLAIEAGTFDPTPPAGSGSPIAAVVTSQGFSPFTVATVTTSVDKSLRLIVAGARRNGTSIYANPTVTPGWTIDASQMQATGLANNSSLTVAEKDMPTAGTSVFEDTVTELGGNFVQTLHIVLNPP